MKILFSVDGSTCSMQAIEEALKMKFAYATELKVISVLGFQSLSSMKDAMEKQRSAARRLVDDAVKRLQAAHPSVSVSGEVLDGYVVERIVEYSEEWPADLIILGSHGRRGMTDFMLGSVSRAVLSLAKCSVRIVRKAPREKEGDGLNVLIAMDESEHSTHMINHVLRLPWPAGTWFRCLSVVESLDEHVLFDPDIEFANAAATHSEEAMGSRKIWLHAAAEKINQAFGDELATVEVVSGDPRDEVLKKAREWPADIIMLGSHGRQGIERLVLGSVSEAVATHAPCSVEVTRLPAFRTSKVHAHA